MLEKQRGHSEIDDAGAMELAFRLPDNKFSSLLDSRTLASPFYRLLIKSRAASLEHRTQHSYSKVPA